MQKVKLGIVVSIFIIASPIRAAKITKAFEALTVYNYFEAKKIFEKTLPTKTSAAAYGLSVIYYKENSPFVNVDSAYKYINISNGAFKYINEEYKEEYQEYGVTQNSIDSLLSLIQIKAFEIYKSYNTLPQINYFINNYKSAPQLAKAIEFRDSIAFSDTKKINRYEAFAAFISKYPQAKEIEKAKELYLIRLFEEETQDNTIEAYEKFLVKYPNNPYVSEAHKHLYALLTPKKSKIEYYHFIKTYPNSPYIEDAWKTLYYISTIDYKPTSIIEFKLDFPDFPYNELLETDLKLSKQHFYPIKEAEKWGFCNEQGKIVIRCKYDWVSDFSEGLAECGINEKSGFINGNGELVIPAIYEEVEPFHHGIAIVQKGEKYGVINKMGKLVVDYIYDEIADFSEGLAAVEKNGKYGYINEKGNLVIPIIYTKAAEFSEGLAGVEFDGKSGYINRDGDTEIAHKYDWVNKFENGLATAKSANKFGVINQGGSHVLPFEYDFLGEFSEDAIMVVKENKYGFSNSKGALIIPIEYDFTGQSMLNLKFKNNRVIGQVGNKQYIIDKSNNKLNSKPFEKVGLFYDGLATVFKKGKWGYIDSTMKVLIPHSFLYADDFKDSIARVKDISGKYGFIDTKGNIAIDFIYDDVTQLNNGWVIVEIDNKKGLVNKQGRRIIPCKYEKITPISESVLKIENGEDFNYFNIASQKYIWNVGEF